MEREIVLIGGGGHAKACIDIIESCKEFRIAGVLDKEERKGEGIFQYRVIGSDKDIERFIEAECWFLITIGQIKNATLRVNLFERIKAANGRFAIIKAPTAYVSKYAQVKEGAIVMHKAMVNASAVIGENCIINTNACIEHDAEIGSNTHVSTHAVVNGGCKIGSRVFVGSGAIIAHGVNVADDVIIGAGTTVHKDISEKGIYIGSPFNRLK